MIVRKILSPRKIVAYVWREMLVFTGFALLVWLLFAQLKWDFFRLSPTPLSIMAAALSIFLGFRTNSAYDRWWEARTLWGGIVNQSRTLARLVLSFTEGNTANREPIEAFEREVIYMQMAFPHALKRTLRRQDPFPDIAPFLPQAMLDDLRNEKNVPAALLLRISLRLKAGHQQGFYDTFRFVSMSETLTELTNLLGGCERIKNTPLPRQYDFFPRLFVWAYCLLLPMALIDTLGFWTVPLTFVVSFIFVTLDGIGANIENPFENQINDTPMTALARTIEINLRQMLGEKELPPPVEPIDGFLY